MSDMKTFLQWLEIAGNYGIEPSLEPTSSRIERDVKKGGGAMPVYTNDPKEIPPTPAHPFMKKKMRRQSSS